MLAKADPQHLIATPAQDSSARKPNVLATNVWLPGLLYDALPYFYLTAGFAAFFTTLYISDWFWIVPHYLLFSAACVHLAYAVFHMRRNTAGEQEPQIDSAADKD